MPAIVFCSVAVPAEVSCGAMDACNPRFAVPAVPAGTERMPAIHILPCQRGRNGCLQPMLCRACEDREDACNPRFAVLAVPARTKVILQPMLCRACDDREDAMPATHVFAVLALPARTKVMPATRILQCLRGRRGCLQPTFAVPARTERLPATHILQCLRCLRGRRRCLQPT